MIHDPDCIKCMAIDARSDDWAKYTAGCPCGCGDCSSCHPNCGKNGIRCPEGQCLGEIALKDDGFYSRCPACGEFIEMCLGHDAMKDPDGWDTVFDHDYGKHENCHPRGCEQKAMRS